MAPRKRAKNNTVGRVTAISPIIRWQVAAFRKCCSKSKVGDIVKSPKFETSLVKSDHVQWYMMLYPRGETEDSKDHLSLYINAKSATKIKAQVNFKILNDKDEVVVDCQLKNAIYGVLSWGRHQLISTEYILNRKNCVLKNNVLTIVCEITTMASQKVKELQPNKKVGEQEAASRLEVFDLYKELMNNGKFSDVTLVAESRKLRVHKCILGINSSVFASIFDAEVKMKKEIIVKIDDVKYNVLQELIRFIYTRNVNNIETVVDELIVAAKKYALHKLVIMCEETMIKSVSCDSVIDRLLLADELKLNKLKLKAIKFVVEKGRDVIDNPKFKSLPYDIVFEVCSSLAKKYES